MKTRWMRYEAGKRENRLAGLISGAVGVGVGLATFYLARLLLAREPLGAAADEDHELAPEE